MGISRSSLILICGLILAVGAAGFGLAYLLAGRQNAGLLEAPRSAAGIRLPVQVGELVPRRGDELRKPLGVAVAADGTVVVADTGRDRIVVFDASGKWEREFGSRGNGAEQFDYPVAVALDAQRDLVYVADFNNSRLSAWSLRGEFRWLLPREAERAKVGTFQPVALAVDAAGNLYASDVSRQRVVVFDPQGGYQREFGGPGREAGQFRFANGLAVSPEGDTVYVADTNNGRVQVFGRDGAFRQSIAQVGDKLLVTPRGLGLDARRNILYIADTVTHQVFVYQLKSGRGAPFGSLGAGREQFNFPNGVAVSAEGRVYITDRDNNRVVVYGYPKR